MQRIPHIHLWCDTCRPLGNQHSSQAVLFHVPARRHWWGAKPGPIVLPLTDWATTENAVSSVPINIIWKKWRLILNLCISMKKVTWISNLRTKIDYPQTKTKQNKFLRNLTDICSTWFSSHKCKMYMFRSFRYRADKRKNQVFIEDISPFVEPLIPWFWTSGDVSSGFQKRQWAALFGLSRGVHVTCSLRFTSGVTIADLLMASMAVRPLSSTYLRAGIGRARNRRTLYWLSYASLSGLHILSYHFLWWKIL